MPLCTVLLLALLQPLIWAQDRLRELPDEQLRIQCTLGILYDAMASEDRDVVYALIHLDDDPTNAVRAAQARRLVANTRFVIAIGRLELAHGDNPFDDHHVFLGDDFAFSLLTGEWDIQGNAATMPPDQRMGGPEQPSAPPLIRVREVWKLDLTPPRPPPNAEQFAKQIEQYAAVLEEAAAEIEAGRLKTVEEIRRALDASPKFQSAGYAPDLVIGPAK